METDDRIKKSNVINFPTQSAFDRFLDDLRDAYKENRLNNFICIYDHEYKKGEEREGFVNGIGNYWFGEKSTIYLLGLLEVMKDEILKYMFDRCNENREMTDGS